MDNIEHFSDKAYLMTIYIYIYIYAYVYIEGANLLAMNVAVCTLTCHMGKVSPLYISFWKLGIISKS